MELNKIDPKFNSKPNPRIGLITLASDFRIEKDFNNLIYGKDIDLFCNRIKCYNPLTNETLKKMADDITCLLYTSPSPRDLSTSRMPSSA